MNDIFCIADRLHADVYKFALDTSANFGLIKDTSLAPLFVRLVRDLEKYDIERVKLSESITYDEIYKSIKDSL